MGDILSADFLQSQESKQIYQQEKLILDITEVIASLMKQKQISQVELARKLKRHKTYVTRLLDGNANLTLKTISDVLFVLDSKLLVEAIPVETKAVLKTKINMMPFDVRDFPERDNWSICSYYESVSTMKHEDKCLTQEMVA